MDSKIADFYQSQPKQEIMAGAPDDEIRVVLIRKTENGKSKTWNPFFVQDIPSIGCIGGISLTTIPSIGCSGGISLTTLCQQRMATPFGKPMCVVDNPGLCANSYDNESIQKEIKFISLTASGPHAAVLMIPVGRFTDEEIMTGAPDSELRVVLIGKTVNGKSKTENPIFVQDIPSIGCIGGISLTTIPSIGCSGGISLTTLCQQRMATRFGKPMCVVDTPGLCANRNDIESIQKEIKFISLTAPRPLAVTRVIPVGRFTDEGVETVNHFVANGKLEQYITPLLTCFDSKNKQSDFLEMSAGKNDLRLVMIRKTGADKSWIRSTDLVKKLAECICSTSSLTTPFRLKNETRFGGQICLVCPQRCFDNRNDIESDQKEIKYSICLQSHVRHAVLQSQSGRVTEEDEETVKYSQSYLGENLVGMILLIVTFLATIRKKKVEVLSEDALLAGHISGPVRITKAHSVGENPKGTFPLTMNENAILMKSHGLAIDDFEDSNKTKLSVNTQSILDSVIISGGMKKDPNYVCERGLKKCQMCIDRNEASYWCNTCRRNICNFCKLYHEKVWMVKNHNIQALL